MTAKNLLKSRKKIMHMRIENGKLIMFTAGIEEYRLYWTDLADTDMRCGNEVKSEGTCCKKE